MGIDGSRLEGIDGGESPCTTMQEFGWWGCSAEAVQESSSLLFSVGAFQRVPVTIMGDILHCLWVTSGVK